MERYVRVLLLGILVMFGLVNNSEAADIASSFEFPVPNYSVTGYDFGDTVYSGVLHLGEDATAAALDPIYASANGHIVPSPITGWHESYGYVVVIEHELPDGDIVYSVSGHMRSDGLMTSGDVSQGDVIGYAGYDYENGDGGPHLHFGIYYGAYSGSWVFYGRGSTTNNWYNPTDFIESHQIPTSAYSAITAKADELWAIQVTGSDCEDRLICNEADNGNMHWYAGPTATNKTFIIEDWHNGTWGNVAITFDPDNTDQTEAYVLRHGFWTYYKANGGPNAFGAPLGDEMDITRLDEYMPYDPYCNAHHGTDYEGCIAEYCYNADDFTSMQRFEHATFCWNPGIYEICQPNSDNSLTCETKNLRYNPDTGRQITTDTNPDPTGPSGTNSWLDADSILDDQYLFIDVNQDGFHDPCVRQGTTLYCDQDLNGQHDWVIEYGSGGAEYFSNGTGVTVRWSNNPNWYNDTDSDSITNSVISYGNGLNETQRLVHNGTVMVRWGDQIYLDDNLDGITNRVYTWPNTGAYPLHLADLNGDGVTDLICQVGNILYVNDDMDNATDWWFTYGYADGSDRYYFADMNGDGRDDILVQRCLVDCNWFLVLDNTGIQTGGIGNNHDWDFTYGHGLSHPINEQDQDGDGYTPNQGDCNDLSTGVHPGHSEIADGVDNDCDGLIDEGIAPTGYENQYLFYDANRDGVDDACVYRYEDLILCDTNLDGYHDVSFHYGNSGAEYFAGGYTLCARFGAWFYCDQTADGISEVGFQIGNGGNDDYQFGYNAAAVRYGGTTYVDSDQNGWTNFAIVWGGTTGWPYYLADMDGDGVVDMIRRSGNTYYVNTNRDSYTNWWFTYGSSSDDVYFADMDGDGRADPMVRRCATVCNRFLVKFNVNLQLNGTPNYHDMEFTYGWGLP